MELKIIDNSVGLSKLNEYLNFRLRGKLNYNHINPNNQKTIFNTIIHYYNLPSDGSIFYFKNDGVFYFGLDKDIINYFNNNRISSISGTFKYQISLKDAFYFAKYMDENNKKHDENIFLLIPVNLNDLSDIELAVLSEKENLVSINNQDFINFGGFNEGINILKNLRNFMRRNTINININSYLKIKSVNVPNFYRNENFCKKCGSSIPKTYENKEFFKEYISNNKGFCVDCYSKMLMGYFVKKSNFPIYMKKEILKKLSKNDDTFNFYFKLFEVYGVFDDEGNILIEDLKNYYNNQIVPNNVSLESLKYKQPKQILNKIHKLVSFRYDEKFSSFEELLFKNGLSYKDGIFILNKLEEDAVFRAFDYSKRMSDDMIIRDIQKKVNDYINQIKKNYVADNYFVAINKLNKLTLNSNGGFNKIFLDNANSTGLDKKDCVKIRNELINKIYDGEINENNIEIELNNRLEQ